jgi:hypothetical protein
VISVSLWLLPVPFQNHTKKSRIDRNKHDITVVSEIVR